MLGGEVICAVAVGFRYELDWGEDEGICGLSLFLPWIASCSEKSQRSDLSATSSPGVEAGFMWDVGTLVSKPPK